MMLRLFRKKKGQLMDVCEEIISEQRWQEAALSVDVNADDTAHVTADNTRRITKTTKTTQRLPLPKRKIK